MLVDTPLGFLFIIYLFIVYLQTILIVFSSQTINEYRLGKNIGWS
jgi:hypothetical protein